MLITTGLVDSDRDCLVEAFPEVRFRVEAGPCAPVCEPGAAQVLFCDRMPPDLLDRAPALEWIQARSAGVDHYPLAEIAARGIVLTNGRGAHGTPVAETALAMMLAFSTGLRYLLPAQSERRWIRPSVAPKRFELEGQTLTVIGLGDLGSTLARKARGIGMVVMGCDLVQPTDTACLARFVASAELDGALAAADHVALCVPLTPQNIGLIDARRLGIMRRGAYLYNMGRGALVDQAALIQALETGALAGAGLDATQSEPIPPDDPLWSAPNVILTQHVGGASPHNSRRVTDLFSQNLHRFRTGYPLLNVVDTDRGF